MIGLTEKQRSNLVLGYCCINTLLRERKNKDGSKGIFCSRSCRLGTLKMNGIEYSYQLAFKNLEDLITILKWNSIKKIYNYRMSSDMFPFSSHLDYYQEYDWEKFRPILERIGKIANKYNIRLTFHPGQYNVISSHNESTVVKSIIEIDIHAKIMDMMKLPKSSIIVIHGGSKNGGKIEALCRFKENFKRLSESAQNRLVIENCEMMYSIEDLLPLSNELTIPIVVDSHHHNINSGSNTKTFTELINECLFIWNKREIDPIFHVSESRIGITNADSMIKRRAHSDYINRIPQEFLDVTNDNRLYIDIEAKCKELAVLALYKKYSI